MGDEPHAKALVIGPSKIGKTTSIGHSATKATGRGYVVSTANLEQLRSLKDMCVKDGLETPDFDIVKSIEGMESCIKTAREGVKGGTYHWVMVDDFGRFTDRILEEFSTAHKGDGRKYWDAYTRHVLNVIERFLDLKVHVFFTMHQLETSNEMDGQIAKSGPGIAPAVQGAMLRQKIPGCFAQFVQMTKAGKEGVRIFRLSSSEIVGPGCNNLPDDLKDIPADVGVLIDAISGRPVVTVEGTNKKR